MENHQILLAFNATMFNLKQMSYEKNNCKDIVVFGTNLGLTINFDFYSKQIREMIELPNFQFSTIIGLYLSNGWSVLSPVRNLYPKLTKKYNLNIKFIFTLFFYWLFVLI